MVLLKKTNNVIQCCQWHKQNACENNQVVTNSGLAYMFLNFFSMDVLCKKCIYMTDLPILT